MKPRHLVFHCLSIFVVNSAMNYGNYLTRPSEEPPSRWWSAGIAQIAFSCTSLNAIAADFRILIRLSQYPFHITEYPFSSFRSYERTSQADGGIAQLYELPCADAQRQKKAECNVFIFNHNLIMCCFVFILTTLCWLFLPCLLYTLETPSFDIHPVLVEAVFRLRHIRRYDFRPLSCECVPVRRC